jgi:hypothetical protein
MLIDIPDEKVAAAVVAAISNDRYRGSILEQISLELIAENKEAIKAAVMKRFTKSIMTKAIKEIMCESDIIDVVKETIDGVISESTREMMRGIRSAEIRQLLRFEATERTT